MQCLAGQSPGTSLQYRTGLENSKTDGQWRYGGGNVFEDYQDQDTEFHGTARIYGNVDWIIHRIHFRRGDCADGDVDHPRNRWVGSNAVDRGAGGPERAGAAGELRELGVREARVLGWRI